MIDKANILLASLALAAASTAAPAIAQTAAEVSVGTNVVDTAGGPVGTVTAVQGDNLLVKTDKHEVAIPRSSFTPSDKGLLFALTREQLNAQVDAKLAEPVVAVGAAVHDPQGEVVGIVKAVDQSFVTVQLANIAVQLPVSAFARGPKGPVIGETAASLEAKAAAASQAATSQTTPETPASDPQ
jgi:preprotein translocase subunit YajC